MKAMCEAAPSLNTLRMHGKGFRVVTSLSHQPVLTRNHMNADRDTQQEKHQWGWCTSFYMTWESPPSSFLISEICFMFNNVYTCVSVWYPWN